MQNMYWQIWSDVVVSHQKTRGKRKNKKERQVFPLKTWEISINMRSVTGVAFPARKTRYIINSKKIIPEAEVKNGKKVSEEIKSDLSYWITVTNLVQRASDMCEETWSRSLTSILETLGYGRKLCIGGYLLTIDIKKKYTRSFSEGCRQSREVFWSLTKQ